LMVTKHLANLHTQLRPGGTFFVSRVVTKRRADAYVGAPAAPTSALAG
jgi:hypothetical protein